MLNYRVNGRERRYTIGQMGAWTAETARAEADSGNGRIRKVDAATAHISTIVQVFGVQGVRQILRETCMSPLHRP